MLVHGPPRSPSAEQNLPPATRLRSAASPDKYAHARARRRGARLEKDRPDVIEQVPPAADPEPERQPEPIPPKEPTYYPFAQHVSNRALFGRLLPYLAFSDWLLITAVCKRIRAQLWADAEVKEMVLERYLRTVGYTRWAWEGPEPLTLTLEDLNAYMRGVSMPTHQYARIAQEYLRTKDRKQYTAVQACAAGCRAFTRVVLRLRAQAEAEAARNARLISSPVRSPRNSPRALGSPPPPSYKAFSQSSSRAPSPSSSWGHGQVVSSPPPPPPSNSFQSPLFRLRRAPLLQVFVPSPEGIWLSDASVLACETELKRARVLPLLRAGDIVWDTAAGDEGNAGRMVWDGSYLIDLDYAYSHAGDLPKYLPTLAFPPSYFHRIIRTMGSGNPICHIDIAPWGEEIASNLQLIQDRMRSETPQGGFHTVVRWVHRSSFTVRPGPGGKPIRIPVPKGAASGPSPTGAWTVDPGWYGSIVVEAEGTNEGLADLQARCGSAFPPRAVGASSPERALPRKAEDRSVFRILREKSRPGEIWIRTVSVKERLLPP